MKARVIHQMRMATLFLISSSLQLLASEHFSHGDWEVACDNTNTCRMAGYTDNTVDNTHFPISIYLERKAGAGTTIVSKIEYANYDQEYMDEKKLKNHILTMRIGAKSFEVSRETNPQAITDEIVNALVEDKKIHFKYGGVYEWEFSRSGTYAVMLKMDDYQKRVGTVGALFKKGKKDESDVLQPIAPPVIYAPQIEKRYRDLPQLDLSKSDKLQLMGALKDGVGDGEDAQTQQTMKIYTITDSLAIVTRDAWGGGYNTANDIWLINSRPPYNPRFIATANDIGVDQLGTLMIYDPQKGRGIGDCWSLEKYVWNGEAFILSLLSNTGQCRGFTGGAWDFPTYVTRIELMDQKSKSR